MTYSIAQIKSLGARPWQARNGSTRYYLNNWAELAGITVHRYNTGNINGIQMPGGEHVSNTKAGKLLGEKVYFTADGILMHDLTSACERLRITTDVAELLETGIERAVSA